MYVGGKLLCIDNKQQVGGYSLHEIIMDKRARLFVFVKRQPSIDDHVTRIIPSILIGKEHHLALSPPCKVHPHLFNL